MHHRALAAVQKCAREVIEGALAIFLFTAVAFESRLVVIRAPGTDVVALTAGALQRADLSSVMHGCKIDTFRR